MKKLYILSAACAALLAANSVEAYDSTGCGLGSMAWRGQSGIAPQILAVTTNGIISGNQTFGITFGTSGCDPNGRVSGGTQRMVFSFLENNMEQYALDAARGEGETLDTLAGILNVDKAEFAKKSQQNFAAIFPDSNVDAIFVTQQIFAMLKA
ncbi:MAG: DUF3015 family protein [Rhodospirillales bacterium]|nr:DUF3015 family protein [Rhodospirillales bacterium]